MLKTKSVLLLFCLVIILNGCSKKVIVTEAIYTDALLVPNASPYHTTEVITGDYTTKTFCNAALYYPNKKALTFQVEGANPVFVEYLVETNEDVKEGTPFANFRIDYDAVALEEKELQRTRAKEFYLSELKAKQSAMEESENTINSMSTGFDKQISILALKKKKLDYEKYKLISEENFSNQEKELADYKNNLTITQLLAPMDGTISYLEEMKEGQEIDRNKKLIIMYSKDIVQLEVSDEAGYLRYNMEVTIEVGSIDGVKTYNGRVISSPNILSNGLSAGVAYVELLDAPEDILWTSNITVHAKPVLMENVLLVASSAVLFNQQSPYVVILEDGKLHKRYFTSGGNNPAHYWILQGLEEGQTVITK